MDTQSYEVLVKALEMLFIISGLLWVVTFTEVLIVLFEHHVSAPTTGVRAEFMVKNLGALAFLSSVLTVLVWVGVYALGS